MHKSSDPCRFGLDCADRLEWRSWQPGTEYAKTLSIRNVSAKAVTFTYKLPQSKVFGMDFPEPVQLLPGMAHALRVTFHPLRKETYEDTVRITVAGYSFPITVAAKLPVVRLKVPEQVDFGLCTVAEVRRAAHPRITDSCGKLYTSRRLSSLERTSAARTAAACLLCCSHV